MTAPRDGKAVDRGMKLTSLTETYYQEEDCCGRPEELGQDLEISALDGGGGFYLVLKTERWALDGEKDIERLVSKLRSVLKRVNK